MMRMMTTLDQCLQHLSTLHPKKIDLSLERMYRLLEKLDNPQNNLPPVIHIAGTNGKGSVQSFLRHILEKDHYHVQAYSSPHLVRFNERIYYGGKTVDDEVLLDALESCMTANQGEEITFFEITSCAAFKIFSENQGDVLLLETGLGGRLDATHVVDMPVATVLTPISKDHEEFLGRDLKKIAFEKAAIQKNQCPSIVAHQDATILEVIEETARKNGALLFRGGYEWGYDIGDDGSWRFYTDHADYPNLPTPGLKGDHQYHNAALALACLHKLGGSGLPLSRQAIYEGIGETFWPARLQHLVPEEYGLNQNIDLWLDGGHNQAAAEILSLQVKKWRDKPLDLIIGMMNNRDVCAFLTPLLPFIRNIIAVEIPNQPNSHKAEYIAETAQKSGIQADFTHSPESAIRLLGKTDQAAHILICGSLYLAGYILAQKNDG